MIKALLAVPPSADLLDFISSIKPAILSQGEYNFLSPNQIFLPLNYLGRLPESSFNQVVSQIQAVVAQSPTFVVSHSHLAAMYQRHQLSPIFWRPQEPQPFVSLYRLIAGSLASLGIPQPRRCEPRLVFASVPKSDPVTAKILVAKINDASFPQPPLFRVTRLVVYRLSSSKKGQNFNPVAEFCLNQA